MNKIMTIILHERTDRNEIAALLAEDAGLYIEVKSDYVSAPVESGQLLLQDFSSDDKIKLYDLLDKSSMLYEVGKNIIVVNRSAKTFNLENSFVRDSEIVDADLTPLPDGTEILIRFEIPGFLESSSRTVSYYYNVGFIPGALITVAELGIIVLGSGATFTIDNSVDCRISFSSLNSVVDDPNYNEIINP